MFLTHESFLSRVRELNSDYWNEGAKYRWEYIEIAILMMQGIGAKDIIEFGASGIPLNSDSIICDYPKFNLDKTPFLTDQGNPLPSKCVDAVCALQVWEHLKNPVAAFAEVRRISRAAILSVPYEWKHGDAQHQNIDMNRILEWTSGLNPDKSVIVRDRIVCLWRF